MLVMPLTVQPTGPVPASSEGPLSPADAAASAPFLAILAAAVSAPLPDPVAATAPTPVAELPDEAAVEGEDSAAVDAGGVMSPSGDTTQLSLADATADHGARGGQPGNASDPSGDLLASPQPRGRTASVGLHDAPVVTPSDESGIEDTSRAPSAADASPTPLDTVPVEAASAGAALLLAQPDPTAATTPVRANDVPADGAGEGSSRAANTTQAPPTSAVPSEAARATAAGVLAAFSVRASVRALSTGSLDAEPKLGGATPFAAAGVVTSERSGAATPDAAPAAAPLLPGVVVSARASGDGPPAATATAPPVSSTMQLPVQEPEAHRVESPPTSETATRADPPTAPSRGTRLPTREDAPAESAPPIRAPWVATPSVLPEPRGEMPDAGRVLAERAPLRTETASSSQVTVELDPETAGASRVRVAVRGDVVHATVLTDAGGVEAMRPQLGELRQALEGQGFREATVQLRTTGDAGAPLAAGGSVELRGRAEQAGTGDGPTPEHQPRGRQRGHDQPTPDQRALIDLDEEQT